jgi:hypothetical protein
MVTQDQEACWTQARWRPYLAMQYIAVCLFDFIVAPILWIMAQHFLLGFEAKMITAWQPLTLQGAGLYHMAMGAILGAAAWGRSKEKIAGLQAQLPNTDYESPSSGPRVNPESRFKD